MASFTNDPLFGLNYDGISIIPSLGLVSSRSNIPIEGFRIVIAGMTSVVCPELIKEIAQLPKPLRCSVHIPRDEYWKENLELAASLNLQDWVFVGLGLNTLDIEQFALENGFNNLLVDVAFGGLPTLVEVGKRLRNKFGSDTNIVTGSIGTQEQTAFLQRCGFNGYRNGQGGSSSICSTKFVSGSYTGVVREIVEIKKYLDETALNDNEFIFADSSFKYPGDFAKSLLLGASYCMSGFMFTKCKNARMHIDGSKQYIGMSNKNHGIRKGQTDYDESFTVDVKEDIELKSLSDVLMEIWGGIRSGYSYAGFSTISSGIGQGEFGIMQMPLNRDITIIK